VSAGFEIEISYQGICAAVPDESKGEVGESGIRLFIP
jgi:hypothetical protein